jgi:hypothetical protein
MKKYRYSLFSLLTSLVVLAGCEDVVDVKLDQGQPQLVVDGVVSDQPGPYVITLSKTAPYFENAQTPRVMGAVVKITDNEGNTETLTETEPGKYVTNTLRGKIGNHYVLEIQAEGEQYRAQTDIKRVPEIDSLKQSFKTKSAFREEGYYVLYYGPEYPGPGDYYRFKIYKNDVLINQPSNLRVRSDEFVEGSYISGSEMNEKPFKVGDRIKIEVCSITEDNYYFYNEMVTQINNGGLFANPPANVRTNVMNRNPGSAKKAVGYFGGMGVRSKQITIQQGK